MRQIKTPAVMGRGKVISSSWSTVCQTEINAEQGRESGSIEGRVATLQIVNSEGLVEKVASERKLKG